MTIRKTVGISSITLIIATVLTAFYVLEELLLPINHVSASGYGLSAIDYRLVSILVNLPLIIIWFVAFWGYSQLKAYSKSLGSSREAPAYRSLAIGIAWLTYGLIIKTMVERLLAALSNTNPALVGPTTIISSYLNLILPLIGFIIIFAASKTLMRLQSSLTKTIKPLQLMGLCLVAGAIYNFTYIRAAGLHSISSHNNIYNLPGWLLLISLILPYLYAWLIGLTASYQLGLISLHSSGILYKKALSYLTIGLITIVIGFMFNQYLSAIWPLKNHLVLNYQLIIILLFRIISGIGFIIAAIGANKLRMIEEL